MSTTIRCMNSCKTKWEIEGKCECGKSIHFCKECAEKYKCSFCTNIPCLNCWSFELCAKCDKIAVSFCKTCSEKPDELIYPITCRKCGHTADKNTET